MALYCRKIDDWREGKDILRLTHPKVLSSLSITSRETTYTLFLGRQINSHEMKIPDNRFNWNIHNVIRIKQASSDTISIDSTFQRYLKGLGGRCPKAMKNSNRMEYFILVIGCKFQAFFCGLSKFKKNNNKTIIRYLKKQRGISLITSSDIWPTITFAVNKFQDRLNVVALF